MQVSSYIVSARKYRPINFEDVVGQKTITDTLKQAVEEDRLAQALLFCGPHGVGKTTCARILARKINTASHQTGKSDFSFNIFELDAASNNSVDDIRNLIDQVRFTPQQGRYKVYIIDEVHMLSQAAFNAFLRTLEEPPRHAIFILATTEKYKILPTILSRCQVYEFRRISVKEIQLHLKNITQKEGIEASDEALFLIAQRADGALRDALSIFDRLVSFAGKALTGEIVVDQLGILDRDYYFKMTDLFLRNDIPQTLLLLDKVLQTGFDAELFIIGLTSHFRDLLVSNDPRTLALLEFDDETKQNYITQAKQTPSDFLIDALELCKHTELNYKSSKNPRLSVEITLMQLASLKTGTSIVKKKLLISFRVEKESLNYLQRMRPLPNRSIPSYKNPQWIPLTNKILQSNR
ncbi:MAG: DNA polymerase III subunit gamma/tau [Flavobacteriales bacterium]